MPNEDGCPYCKSPLALRTDGRPGLYYRCGVSSIADGSPPTTWCIDRQIQNVTKEVADLYELLAAQSELRIANVKLTRESPLGAWTARIRGEDRRFGSVKEAIEAAREPLLETSGRPHKFHSCNEPNCTVCNGGLLHCDTCGASEGELPTECPNMRMTVAELRAVYGKELDFTDGRWLARCEPMVLTADQEREIRGNGQRADDAGRLLKELDATRVQLVLARNMP